MPQRSKNTKEAKMAPKPRGYGLDVLETSSIITQEKEVYVPAEENNAERNTANRDSMRQNKVFKNTTTASSRTIQIDTAKIARGWKVDENTTDEHSTLFGVSIGGTGQGGRQQVMNNKTRNHSTQFTGNVGDLASFERVMNTLHRNEPDKGVHQTTVSDKTSGLSKAREKLKHLLS